MKENPMTSDTPKSAKAKITRTRKAAASRAEGLLASARGLAGQAGAASASLAETFPDAADTLKGTALTAYRTVESMPKSQQRTLTRASLGIGAALFILGAPRILTFLAFLPAIAVAGMRMAKHRA
jgi:hypothetical protein